MSNRLLTIMQQIAKEEIILQRHSLFGVVTAVFVHEAEDDDNNYEVNVKIKHEDLELRKVPIAAGFIGIVVPPRVDDLVLVEFVNGDVNQPVVIGRFYHGDDRAPLHKNDDLLFEHRVPDGTLNHLRFASDGSIFLQRDVTKPEDNSEAKAGIQIDPDGNISMKAGESIVIILTNDDNIEITADGKAITVNCDNMTINGILTVSGASGSTEINGTTITGS